VSDEVHQFAYCDHTAQNFNGEIVGYALGERIAKDLVVSSLLMAIQRKQPDPGLIHHSDQGSQYCSHAFTRLLDLFKIRVSLSRSGNCYDNAPWKASGEY